MTPLNFAIVGLRLLGIYFVLESISTFATTAIVRAITEQMSESVGAPAHNTYMASLVPGVTLGFFGIVLFAFAAPLSRRLSPGATDDAQESKWTLEDIQAIAFAAAGALILAGALPSLGRAIHSLYLAYQDQQFGNSSSPIQLRETWMYSVGVLGQLVIGLLLLLKPQAFRNLWHWMRTAGTQPPA